MKTSNLGQFYLASQVNFLALNIVQQQNFAAVLHNHMGSERDRESVCVSGREATSKRYKNQLGGVHKQQYLGDLGYKLRDDSE
jgi:hypothetical protein